MTEREHLSEAPASAETYLDLTDTFMVALDRQGRAVMVNRAARERLGYAEGEPIGATWFGPLFSGDFPAVRTFESRVQGRDGAELLIRWCNSQLRDEVGRAVGVLCSGEDVTEYRRLDAEQHRRLEEIQRIGSIAGSSLDLDEVFARILAGTTRAIGAQVGMIFLREGGSGILRWGASLGLTPEFVTEFEKVPIRLGEGLTGTIATTGEPIFIHKASSHDPRIARSVIGREGLESFIGVPLRADGEIIGVMNILTLPPLRLREDDLHFCAAVGAQVGLAIRHAQVFAEQREIEKRLTESRGRLETFLEVSGQIAEASEPEGLMQAIVDSATRSVGLSSGAVYIRAGPDTVSLAATTPALPPDFPDQLRVASLTDHPHLREAIRTGSPVVIADPEATTLTDAEREVLALRNLRVILYLPIVLRDEAIGVLILSSSDETYSFVEEDVALLQGFASQAARVIWNVQTYTEAKRQARELEQEIAERTRAEEELRRSEARLRSYVANAPIGVFVVDEQGRYVEVNPAATRISGYTEEALLRMSIVDLLPPESRAPGLAHFRQLQEDGFAVSGDVAYRHASGEIRYWRVSAARVSENRFIGFQVDTTALRAAQAELRRFKTVSEMAVHGIGINDLDGTFRYVNPFFARIHGYEPADLIGRHFSVFHTPAQMAAVERELGTLLEEGSFSPRMVWHVHRDGTEFPMLMSAVILADDDGAPRWLATSAIDMTEYHRVEQDYRALFENMTAGFVLFDVVVDERGDPVDLVVLAANHGFASTTGVPVEAALGRRLSEIVPGIQDDEADWIGTFGRIALTGEPRQVEQGSKVLGAWYSVAAFRAGPGQCAVTFVDVTDRKRAEEERDRIQAQLTHAQKLESVGRLAGGVAHDFNNMLGVILGHVEMALDQVEPADALHADLTEIRKAAQRSADLTRQLLAFARKQTISPRVLDLNTTISGMLRMLHRLIGEDIDLAWKPGPSLWPVRVDPAQIDQVLANLCVNARDAIAGVGRITIETANVALDEDATSRHEDATPGDYVMLAVSDDGSGMDEETVSHLFEPFFTTKEVGRGTGLGLATVYGAVKQNKGFVSVYSEEGEGTTLKVYLPRHLWGAEPEVKHGEPVAARRGTETILVVEDEPAILQMVAKMLEKLGYTVLTAPSPGEAMALARDHVGSIDLLLTDVVMPEMSGRDLARNLLSVYPEVRPLFMSGYPAGAIAHRGVLEDGVHFIQKPFALNDLAAAVRRALAGDGSEP